MSTPKHAAIANALREETRELPVGFRLPSEKDLAARFEVSRMTVRQALDALAADGRVERVPGSGTFVRRPTVAMGPNLTSFSEDMRGRGLRPSSQLIALEEVPADHEIALDLGVDEGSTLVRLERLRFADDDPMCLEEGHLPGRFQRILDDADLESSLHEVLAKAGTVVAAARRRVRAVPARPGTRSCSAWRNTHQPWRSWTSSTTPAAGRCTAPGPATATTGTRSCPTLPLRHTDEGDEHMTWTAPPAPTCRNGPARTVT